MQDKKEKACKTKFILWQDKKQKVARQKGICLAANGKNIKGKIRKHTGMD